MNKSDIRKHVAGHILGGIVFLMLMPLVIYLVSFISSVSIGLSGYPIKYVIYSVTTLLALVGGFFAIWSNIDLLIVGKGGPADLFNKSISPRSKRLVTSGSYRYTRNPMAFGMNSLYIAFSIFLDSLSALLFCLLFLLTIIIYLKLTEEKRLFKDFGNEYIEYKKRVSMIIPLPSSKNIENQNEMGSE